MYKIAKEKFTHALPDDFVEYSDIRTALLNIFPPDFHSEVVYYNEDDTLGEFPMRYLSLDDYITDIIGQLDEGMVLQYCIYGQYYTVMSG